MFHQLLSGNRAGTANKVERAPGHSSHKVMSCTFGDCVRRAPDEAHLEQNGSLLRQLADPTSCEGERDLNPGLKDNFALFDSRGPQVEEQVLCSRPPSVESTCGTFGNASLKQFGLEEDHSAAQGWDVTWCYHVLLLACQRLGQEVGFSS